MKSNYLCIDTKETISLIPTRGWPALNMGSKPTPITADEHQDQEQCHNADDMIVVSEMGEQWSAA
jgi:hypothetical protein